MLVTESTTEVTYRTDRRCRVTTGRWLAPYSGTIITDPGNLDVDHMIPLANAHESGAWDWLAERKELYANYLDQAEHLIAVTARANRSKGAKAPIGGSLRHAPTGASTRSTGSLSRASGTLQSLRRSMQRWAKCLTPAPIHRFS